MQTRIHYPLPGRIEYLYAVEYQTYISQETTCSYPNRKPHPAYTAFSELYKGICPKNLSVSDL